MNLGNSTDDASIVEKAVSFYAYTLTLADNRTRGWLLVDSPVPTLFLTGLYLLAVKIGPILMANRKPFQLRSALIVYSLTMSLVNLYICKELFVASQRLHYDYRCEPCRESYAPDSIRIAKAIWWFYFSKLLEFMDSFFFVLRRKDNQLTFLHVYHHSTMFPLWWIGVKWVPGGSSFLPAMINSTVHVIMYLYYALAAMGPTVAKYLWWKRYLTMIQLIQFTIAMTASGVTLYYDCEFPLWMHYLLIGYMISFLVLFGNFYMKAYLAKGRSRPVAVTAATSTADLKESVTVSPTKSMDFILSHDGKKIK